MTTDLRTFAEQAIEAAERVRRTPGWEWGVFGDSKVFIHAAYQIGDFEETLSEFKERLLRALSKGYVVLARADLVSAMDSHDVYKSEIDDGISTFNFIKLPPSRRR